MVDACMLDTSIIFYNGVGDIVHTYTYSGAGFLQRCVPARAIEHQQRARDNNLKQIINTA